MPGAGAVSWARSLDLMANPFPRTTRSLRGEEGISHLLFPAACALLLIVWALWLVRARFPVYVASEAARLESCRAPVLIAAQVGGVCGAWRSGSARPWLPAISWPSWTPKWRPAVWRR